MASALAILKMVNTGVLIYEQVAPLVTGALQNNTDVSLEDVAAASGRSASALQELADAIERAEAEGR